MSSGRETAIVTEQQPTAAGSTSVQLRVLMIIDHAPDYRESFLRELGRNCLLTVVAQSCDTGGLVAPDTREGYEYIELASVRIGPFVWQSGIRQLVSDPAWDILCVGLNLRHLARLRAFIWAKHVRRKWVWHGHILGRFNLGVIDWIRRWLLRRGAGCLTYSENQVARVRRRLGTDARSFNNTEVSLAEFRTREIGSGRASDRRHLRLLFVGRFQARKRLERLVALAERLENVHVRFVGPGMDQLVVDNDLVRSGRVTVYGKLTGAELIEHFDWADLVANPGHVGLLVMNAARHGKPIVIDSKSEHAPEFWLAKNAEQPFIDFSESRAVDDFVRSVMDNREILEKWGDDLQRIAKERYTIEYMAVAHLAVFAEVAATGRESRS